MYKVLLSHHFRQQLKKLIKKDESLKDHLLEALTNFHHEHSIPIGKRIYKIRIGSDTRGKSGGYRAYVFVIEIEKTLAPIAIYAKSQQESISEAEVLEHLVKVRSELEIEMKNQER